MVLLDWELLAPFKLQLPGLSAAAIRMPATNFSMLFVTGSVLRSFHQDNQHPDSCVDRCGAERFWSRLQNARGYSFALGIAVPM